MMKLLVAAAILFIVLTVIACSQVSGLGSLTKKWEEALATHPASTQSFIFDSTVTAIPPEIERLTSLREVRFVHSSITDLPDEFYSLPLEYVEFFGTTKLHLSKVLSRLKNCRKLIHVTLSHMDSNVIPIEVGELTQLQSLAIWDTPLRTLPESIGNLTSLEVLSLAATGIDTLPVSVQNMVKLKVVSLEHGGHRELPVNFLKIPNLTEILLDNNPEMNMDHILSQLTIYAMESISMRDCNLTKLPEAVSSMRTLKRLVIDNNNLTSLPAFITELSNMEWLWVKNNQIKYLPFDLGKLMKLKYLEVSSNNLTELPLSLDSLKDQLVNLVAGNNMFSAGEKERIRKTFSKVYLEL